MFTQRTQSRCTLLLIYLNMGTGEVWKSHRYFVVNLKPQHCSSLILPFSLFLCPLINFYNPPFSFTLLPLLLVLINVIPIDFSSFFPSKPILWDCWSDLKSICLIYLIYPRKRETESVWQVRGDLQPALNLFRVFVQLLRSALTFWTQTQLSLILCYN